jgi:hypothetical protein
MMAGSAPPLWPKGPSMSNIFRLFYNDFVTINFMPSSRSVHSGLRRFHFLDMSSLLKVLQLTQVRLKKYLIGSLQDR